MRNSRPGVPRARDGSCSWGALDGLLAALYYVAAKIGLRLAYLHGTVTALWPPVGVGIAALVLYGTRLWPGIVIGDLLAADFSSPLGTVFGQTLGNTLEIVVAAVLLRRLIGESDGPGAGGRRLRAGRCRCRGRADQRELRRHVAAPGGGHPGRPVRRGLADVVAFGLLGRAGGHPADPHVGDPRSARALALGPARGGRAARPPSCCWPSSRPSATSRTSSSPCSSGPRCASDPGRVHGARGRVGRSPSGTRRTTPGRSSAQSITDSLLSSQLFLATAALTALVLAAVTAERARADEALRANEERLRSVVQSMAEGLIVRDASGIITDCNAAAEQIVGLSRDRLRGRRPEDVIGGRRWKPTLGRCPEAGSWATRR